VLFVRHLEILGKREISSDQIWPVLRESAALGIYGFRLLICALELKLDVWK